jgi:hypothetical protein
VALLLVEAAAASPQPRVQARRAVAARVGGQEVKVVQTAAAGLLPIALRIAGRSCRRWK